MNTASFQKLVWNFYLKNKRDLPWRKNINPYRILVSEIMLQQTQVSRGLTKFPEFIKAFPNFKTLAAASTSDVLKVWSGLGYNRRALFLKKTAEIVVKDFGGKLPSSLEELVKLPGVGPNTAGAILAYAFNKPTVFIETNIRKVYIYHFFKGKKNVHDKDILKYVKKTFPQKVTLSDGRQKVLPREWYWALMDYGTYLSSQITNPNHSSKHYTKQSKFAGSLRQVRGKILKLMLEQGSMAKRDLLKNIRDNRLGAALQQLMSEGFVEFKNSKYKIKSSQD